MLFRATKLSDEICWYYGVLKKLAGESYSVTKTYVMKSIYVLATLLVVVLVSSCKKETKETVLPVAHIDMGMKWDETVVKVAKDVSVKLNSTAFRKMLKHEVLLRFDGDANILISSMLKRLPKYLAYEKNQATLNRTDADDPLLSSFNFDILEEAANDFPQMQLAVQTDAENWDAVSFVPEVVYLTANYDESTHSFVNGYDANQNPITASTLEDPVDNYVVVSQNERTIQRDDDVVRIRDTECPVDEILLDEPYNPESIPEEVEPCDGIGGIGGGGGSGGGGTGSGGSSSNSQYVGTGQDGVLPTLIDRQMGENTAPPPNGTFNRLNPVGTINGVTFYRKNFKHEKMRFIKINNLGEIEGWPSGAPEIRFHRFVQNVTNPSENLQIFERTFEPTKRKDIKDKWWDVGGVEMHLWDFEATGTRVTFAYYEYDPVVFPNETLSQIGGIIVDILNITGVVSDSTIYANIRQSVVTGIRSLKKKNGMSETIGPNEYSIFNDADEFIHRPYGATVYIKTWPDL